MAMCSYLQAPQTSGVPSHVPEPQFPPLHHGAPCALCAVPGGLGFVGLDSGTLTPTTPAQPPGRTEKPWPAGCCQFQQLLVARE